MNKIKTSGFTLIELLVVTAIIAVLAAIAIQALAGSVGKAKLASEVAAGKSLTAALQMYAADNNGDVLPGFVDPAKVNQTVVDKDGKRISGEPAKRYPWRLAPYLGYDVNKAFLASGQEILNNDLIYTVSAIPSLGMNTVSLGGDEGKARSNPFNPRFAAAFARDGGVRKMMQVLRPSQMIAFVSAAAPAFMGSESQPGHFRVEHPAVNVAFRHSGNKALVVFVDGHTELMDREQLKNERLWKNLPSTDYAMH
jgi:prepilin-type N-terminal cleavage/methylation domain-containing protein/prepilin-type processing-associated H-X9-DG protein